ncbi:MAG: hypothetical protein U9R56_07860, partial [candidate division Zixibacteria bacterium]|nr:hypothetical protein [candidate division Zixibacteria bacterium]
FRWPELSVISEKADFLDENLSFKLILEGKAVGWAGKVTDRIARMTDIKQPVYVAELELTPLETRRNTLIEFQTLPVYPAAPRDLAILVDADVPAGEIVSCIRKEAGKLAESVDVFDLYAGKQIESGKKSIAITINYRSLTGSLSSREVDDVQGIVVSKLKHRFGAEIRDR